MQKGTAFESLAIALLRNLKFDLKPCGGPHDGGIDFSGVWTPFGVSVAGQCKSSSKPLGVGTMRDFESAVTRLGPASVGVLVASSGFSPFALRSPQAPPPRHGDVAGTRASFRIPSCSLRCRRTASCRFVQTLGRIECCRRFRLGAASNGTPVNGPSPSAPTERMWPFKSIRLAINLTKAAFFVFLFGRASGRSSALKGRLFGAMMSI
jgi:hypothetical protein